MFYLILRRFDVVFCKKNSIISAFSRSVEASALRKRKVYDNRDLFRGLYNLNKAFVFPPFARPFSYYSILSF